ncbi:MAG: aminodeoxychorismate/anthranilate synthase component II [Cyclobacterium sp.]|uniref:anthranilate synthase component II n=1 Tax=Cyclobacterium sp. TaxID=1966343 RepID=UPI0039709411
MILLIDNFDSFSHILADYFRRSGEEVMVLRNDVSPDVLSELDFAALVLSPGPGRPESAGNLMPIVARYFDKVPVLGVCLGHQALGIHLGARLQRSSRPMHGKVSWVKQTSRQAFLKGVPDQFQVTRYHSLELKGLPPELEVVLETEQGEIMAMCHQNLPVIGLQFHPEAHLTSCGEKIIGNWVDLYAREKITKILAE